MAEWNEICLGAHPEDEDGARLGDPDFIAKNIAEAVAFRQAIRRKFGPPPEGVVIKAESKREVWGPFCQVYVQYDPDNAEAMAFAYRVQDRAPKTFGEIGMVHPRDEKGCSGEGRGLARSMPC